MPRWLNPANLLTLIRLLLAPAAILAILAHAPARALEVFFVAAVTDGIDGWLARRFAWSSAAGAYLDPIADKVLLSGIYLALVAVHSLPWWFVGLIFGRDLFILGACVIALLFTHLRQFPPSVWGKLSTLFQIGMAVTVLARDATTSVVLGTLTEALIWPTAAITLWSGIHYAWRGLRLVRVH